MPVFGFSAFLKILSSRDRPQQTEIRKRFAPRSGGYDYHRSLKQRAHRYLVGGESIVDVLASCDEITRLPERRSARAALENLAEWREANPGSTMSFGSRLFASPGGLFKVQFTPDFGLQIGGLGTAVHLYNTLVPLAPRMVYAALSLFPSLYGSDEDGPDDLAVLSLRDRRLYRLSEATDHVALGSGVVGALDNLMQEIREEPARTPRGDRPGPQPPA